MPWLVLPGLGLLACTIAITITRREQMLSFVHLLLTALVLPHCVQTFSSCHDQELPSSCDAQTYRGGFSYCGAPAPGLGPSVVVTLKFSNCDSWTL